MAEKTSETVSREAREFYQRALAALERNNLDYAISMFLQALTLEPNFTRARQYLRAAQVKKAESSGSLKRVFTAARSMPLLTKAKVAASKNPVEAMDLAEQILSEDPRQTQALIVLAEAAEVGGFAETTVQTLEHYLKVAPKDTKIMHWLARCYHKLEMYEQARDTYDRILQINPGDFAAQKGLKDSTAHGAMAGGGWEEAESYRDVIKDKEQAVALEQQSRVVRAEDMIDNLLREHLAKLKKEPDNPVIKRDLAKLYGQKGDFDAALGILEKVFAAEGGADPSLEREISEVRTKRLEAKIKAKTKQAASQPDSAALKQELAALEKERDELHLQQAEHLVERYPNDLMYRFDLGVLYVRLGRTQEAIEQFQRSVGQPQRRVASLNYLGQCFQQVGLHDLAVDQFSKAIEELTTMDTLKKELIYNLGCTYEAMGDTAKAVAEFKKIAAVDYGYRDVKDRIARKPAKPAG